MHSVAYIHCFPIAVVVFACHHIRTSLQPGVPSFLIAKKPVFHNLILSSQQAFSFQVWLNIFAPPTKRRSCAMEN